MTWRKIQVVQYKGGVGEETKLDGNADGRHIGLMTPNKSWKSLWMMNIICTMAISGCHWDLEDVEYSAIVKPGQQRVRKEKNIEQRRETEEGW